MKSYIVIGITLVLTVAAVIGCGGGGGGGSAATETSAYTVYTNPTDGLLFSETTSGGTSVTYHGTKDAEGNPLSLTSIAVQDPTVDGEFVYTFNEENKLGRIDAPEGVVFEFEQDTETSAVVKIYGESGELQFSFPIPFAYSGSAGLPQADSTEKPLSVRDTESIFNLYVTKCDKPVKDANIRMTITPAIGTSQPVGENRGEGWYVFNVPKSSENQPSEAYLKKCEKIATKVDGACKYWPSLKAVLKSENPCNDLDAAFELAKQGIEFNYTVLKPNPEKLEKRLAKAMETFEAVKTYCQPALIALLPKICESDNKALAFSQICKEKHFKFLEPQPQVTYTYAFSISTPGSASMTTAPNEFDPDSAYTMEMEIPREITCEKIYTVPENPKVTDIYMAKASMLCPNPLDGTDVTLSVSGSDGHTDSVTENIKADTEIELDVPAVAEENIEKDITDVIIVEAEGKKWSEPVTSSPGLHNAAATAEEESKTWIKVIKKEAGAVSDEKIASVYIIARDLDATYYTSYSDSNGSTTHSASFPIEADATVSSSGTTVTESHNVVWTDGNHYVGSKQLTFDAAFENVTGFSANASIDSDLSWSMQWSLSGSGNIPTDSTAYSSSGRNLSRSLSGSGNIPLISSGDTYKEYKVSGTSTCSHISSMSYFRDYGSWTETLVGSWSCSEESSLTITVNLEN